MGGLWLHVVRKICATRQVKEENWTEKTWSKLVMETLKEGAKSRKGKRNSKKGRSGGLHAKTQAIMPSKIHKRKEWQ